MPKRSFPKESLMAGAAAATAAAPPETALPAADGPGYDGEDYEGEECRICRLPAEADRPLRRPCACRGSIRFVHDDCQLRWLAARQQNRCEVCNRDISTRPLYAADAPARLHVSELMAGLPRKLMGLLLPYSSPSVSFGSLSFRSPPSGHGILRSPRPLLKCTIYSPYAYL